ncbi:mannosyltransferase [Lentzea tibetensis]|uniref:Mannosyltransferase n=1 Tax=Lentzea tibetensis TaxID=2591470 RepID=A0A563EN26_9PSEU|nr:mannosyltransferase [Lentzea tibetensis]TWP48586.1 mannosyltransferase [Lentzea tibetensis]
MKLRAVEARVLSVAPWLLALSVAGHLLMVQFQAKMTMIDLLVYRNGSPHLFAGDLYEWRLDQYADVFPLPFTYPPFAAAIFTPMSWIPWEASRWVWQLLCLACLWFIVRTSFKLIGRYDPRRVMLWTGLTLWIEPVRTTLNYGQVNLVLAAVLIGTLASARSYVAGAGVGVTAGIKLTPAISGLYFLITRKWAAAAWSFAAFVATFGIGHLISPGQSNKFWFELLGDASRVGPVGSAINQSMRGAISRTLGYDVKTGIPYLLCVLVAAALTWYAVSKTKDTLALIISVQFLGLLVSPISWSHHWVWMVPALVWLIYQGGHRLCTVAAVAWVLATGGYLISFLLMAQPNIWDFPRPWYFSLLGWGYPAAGLLTLAAIGLATRRQRDDLLTGDQEAADRETSGVTG